MFRWFTRQPIKPEVLSKEDDFVVIDTEPDVTTDFECKYFTEEEIWDRNENGEQNDTIMEHIECIEDDTDNPTHDIHYREPIIDYGETIIEEQYPTHDTKKKETLHEVPVFFSHEYTIVPSPTEDAIEKQLRYMLSFMLSFDIIVEKCIADLCHL